MRWKRIVLTTIPESTVFFSFTIQPNAQRGRRKKGKKNAPSRARTCDLSVNSRTHCQLCYRGNWHFEREKQWFLIFSSQNLKKKKRGHCRAWTSDLSICSRMLYHWAKYPRLIFFILWRWFGPIFLLFWFFSSLPKRGVKMKFFGFLKRTNQSAFFLFSFGKKKSKNFEKWKSWVERSK